MKEPMILRTELLTRLSEIYDQLEELEDVFHSSILSQPGNVQKQQKDRVDYCTKNLSRLEAEITKQTAEKLSLNKAVENLSKKPAMGIQFDLSLESL